MAHSTFRMEINVNFILSKFENMTHGDVSKTEYLIYADIIRICSVLGVVVLHVSGQVQESYNSIGLYGWWAGNIGDSVTRWAVPSLIMLAGALHLDLKKVEPASIFLKKRAKRIVVPLMGWFLIYFLWVHFWRGQSINLEFIVKRIVLGGPYYHLYFLYVIGSLYLITPALRLYIRCASMVSKIKLTITFFPLGFLDSFFFYLLHHQAGWYDSISSFFPLFVFTLALSVIS
jgi:surface polysaccharide O-acyltransferase-like enzyme